MDDAHVRTTILTYDKTADEYIEKVQKYAPIPEREKFISFIKSGGKILDAGCGSGRDSVYFASHGYTITGVDLSGRLLSYAQAHSVPGVNYMVMDLRTISFGPQTFDGIWASASLLHLTRSEMKPVLRKFHDILKPDGTLFMLMKEGQGERMVTGGTVKEDERFFSYYSVTELRSLVEDAGFSVMDMYTWDQHDRLAERPHEVWIAVFAQKRT